MIFEDVFPSFLFFIWCVDVLLTKQLIACVGLMMMISFYCSVFVLPPLSSLSHFLSALSVSQPGVLHLQKNVKRGFRN